ncbi:hypothetical protein H4R19_004232 [Coemansia spiralis]|nr:hypothetical protein H4R19_004232 [Coemansia spiralis]
MRWLDTINEHDLNIRYSKGAENGLADAISRRTDLHINATSTAEPDPVFLDAVRNGYAHDGAFAAVLYDALQHPADPMQKNLVTKTKRFRIAV